MAVAAFFDLSKPFDRISLEIFSIEQGLSLWLYCKSPTQKPSDQPNLNNKSSKMNFERNQIAIAHNKVFHNVPYSELFNSVLMSRVCRT